MTKKVIFTLTMRPPMDLVGADDTFPFTFDCFYFTKAHYDLKGIDPRKLPDDLNPMNEEAVREDLSAVHGITMRSRFANDTEGPFLISVPDEVTEFDRDDLERLVRGWFADGTLKEKLKEAKF